MSFLEPGHSFKHYRILNKIGAGGMGEVYLAHDEKLDRKVALKILPAEVADDRGRMNRFVQEAKAASALNHPNILTIYEIDQTDSGHYIATEFIDGETLRQRMKITPLKLGGVLDIAAQIASALSAAHAAGIVHRDIKPENIMLRRDGIAKVLDFGLAKLTERLPADSVDTEAPTNFKTDPGVVLGTAFYMSPEQARGMTVDARTDIWSLGIVLYEMVAGCLPFAGSTKSEVLASILNEKEPPPLARFARDVPAELERIVAKALRKNRDERYQTVKDLLLDLKSLKQELEFERKLERSVPPRSPSATDTTEALAGTVMESAARPTAPERGPTSTLFNKRSVVIALAALLIIASTAGAYLYFTRVGSAAIESIAVLPFVNASGNSDMEYLSDGMTESLITSLSQLPKLSVKARSSVFRYKGKDAPPQQVGKELNVQAILNGRVVQRGNDLILHIELVDVKTETALWSADYNRSMTNLVLLQSEIAHDVSNKLRVQLSGADKQRLAKNPTANAEAYQLYLKGRYAWNKRSEEWVKKGIEYFNQAIEVDPNYALAFAGLADSYNVLGILGYLPAKEAYPKARAAATKALEIDDALAEAHTSLARVKQDYEWDWRGAEQEYKRAIELNPNYPTAHHWYDILLSLMGRHEEALAEAKRAQELDPLSIIINSNVGWVLFNMGQVDQAIEQERKTLELDPNFVFALDRLARFYEFKEMYGEAVANYLKARTLSGAGPEAVAALKEAYATSGIKGYWRRRVQQLRIQAQHGYVSRYSIAEAHARLGERDQAFERLQEGYEEHENIAYLKVDPMLNSLRSDPRFQELVQRIGL